MQVDEDQTGDDGLTPGERAEAAAEAAGTKPGADVIADAAAATAAAAAEADAKAALAKEEPKVDPTVAALTAAADKIGAGVEKLVAAAQPKAAPVEEVKQRDFDKERADLKAALEKGEIDDDEYETKREQILEDKAEFKADQKLNARLETQTKAQLDDAWNRDRDRFRNEPANAKLYESKARLAVFNQMVQDVAVENPHGTNDQWLTEARNRTFKEFGLPVDGADPKAAADAIAKAERERAAKAGERPNPSIANVPAAGATDAATPDWMARLDAMPISDQEDALAHLKPEQLEQYLSTARGGLSDNPRAK